MISILLGPKSYSSEQYGLVLYECQDTEEGSSYCASANGYLCSLFSITVSIFLPTSCLFWIFLPLNYFLSMHLTLSFLVETLEALVFLWEAGSGFHLQEQLVILIKCNFDKADFSSKQHFSLGLSLPFPIHHCLRMPGRPGHVVTGLETSACLLPNLVRVCFRQPCLTKKNTNTGSSFDTAKGNFLLSRDLQFASYFL